MVLPKKLIAASAAIAVLASALAAGRAGATPPGPPRIKTAAEVMRERFAAMNSPATPAPAPTVTRSYFLVLRDEAGDRAWTEKTCVLMHNLLTLEGKQEADTQCIAPGFAADAGQKIQAARASGKYRSQLTLHRQNDGSLSLTADNWAKKDETDFERASWNISVQKGEDDQRQALQLKLKRFLEFESNQRLFKEYILTQNLGSSSRVRLNDRGQYYDNWSNRKVTFNQAYEIFKNERPKNKHFLRATLEIGAVLGIGAISYFASPGLQDNDVGTYWEGWRMRLNGKAYLFDDNTMSLNAVQHPYSGYLSYSFARANGFTSIESFLFSFTSSLVWEFVVEAREVVSLNDMVMTPVAGSIMGEVFHQITTHFLSRKPTVVNKILATIFGGPQALNAFVSKNLNGHFAGEEVADMGAKTWAKFNVFGGGRTMLGGTGTDGSSATAVDVGFEAELFNIPGYGEAGKIARVVSGTPYAQFMTRASLTPAGMQEFLFFVKTALIGYYKQNIREGKTPSELKGYSFFIGPGLAYNYQDNRAPATRDQYGVVNVLGPMIDMTLYLGGTRIRLNLDVYGDFAAVRSFAIDEYKATGALDTQRQVLQKHDYYYALGISPSAGVTVTHGRFEVGAKLDYHHFDSLDGLDRMQQDIVNDIHLKDSRSALNVWVGYTLPKDRLRLSLGLMRRTYSGSIDDLTVKKKDLTLYGRVSLPF